jgi:hypothetical protein
MTTSIQVNSHQVTRNRDGVVAEVQLVCPWADIASVRPRMGQAHPSEFGLYCTEVTEKGEGTPASDYTYSHCRITARYSTFQRIEDTVPEMSMEFGGEMLETGLGRHWQNAPTVCDQSLAVFYPLLIINYSFVMSAIPLVFILSCVGKVNWQPWQGFAAETLLFEGASTDSRWDFERSIYFYRMSYRFQFRPTGHNVVWRAPRQGRNPMGDLADTGEPYHNPLFIDGPAGIGGWDRPVPALYECTDFSGLFGWQVTPDLPPAPVIPVYPVYPT